MVGVTDGLSQAHHMIPIALSNNPLIQKAANAARKPFHIHHPHNGVGVKTVNHTGHGPYSNAVLAKLGSDNIDPDAITILNKIKQEAGSLENASPKFVSTEVKNFQNWLHNLIENNQDVHINTLVDAIDNYDPF